MLSIFFLTVFLLTNSSSIDCRFKSSDQADCPTINVSCPDSVDSGKPLKFKVNVSGGKAQRELSYNWSVSKGTIKSGQGTTTIEVDLNGQDCEGVTATVEVNGYDPNCPRVASCTTCIP